MEPFNITVENPWLKLVEDNGIIAECDKNAFPNSLSAAQYAEAINKGNKETGLTFACLPDPFCGNPHSKVYCLNKNSGKPDYCFSDEEVFKYASIKNLRLEQDSCLGAKGIRNNTLNYK